MKLRKLFHRLKIIRYTLFWIFCIFFNVMHVSYCFAYLHFSYMHKHPQSNYQLWECNSFVPLCVIFVLKKLRKQIRLVNKYNNKIMWQKLNALFVYPFLYLLTYLPTRHVQLQTRRVSHKIDVLKINVTLTSKRYIRNYSTIDRE